MSQNQKDDVFKEIIGTLKENYKTPGKVLLWGMAVRQWTAILIVGGVFLYVFVFSNFFFRRGFTIGEEKPIFANNEVVIKDITEFLEVSAKSLKDRREVLQNVMETVIYYAGRPLDQQDLEAKVKGLTSDLTRCNSSRAHYITMFSYVTNPFENPEVSKRFEKLIGSRSLFEKHAIDPQEDNQQWKVLCDYCQTELNKANEELVKSLNGRPTTQAVVDGKK